MPSFGQSYSFDWPRWRACLAKVAAQMTRDGWNNRARKFYDVQQRHAMKLYKQGAK